MGELYKVGGNGMSGASSDECTASASDVTAGLTAVTKDSDDEPIQGTMPVYNYDTSRMTSNLFQSGSNIYMRYPEGRHKANTDGSLPLIGANATNFGDVSANEVLTGKKYTSKDGLTKTGTMEAVHYQDCTGEYGTNSTGYFIRFPRNKFYMPSNNIPNSTEGDNPYVNVTKAQVANMIGLQANNIRSGVTISGVTGTLVDYGASRTVFNNGTFDGVLVSGMSQNWNAYRVKMTSTLYNSADGTLYHQTLPELYSNAYSTSRYLVGAFNYAFDLTPFKSITITLHNYGRVWWDTDTKYTASEASIVLFNPSDLTDKTYFTAKGALTTLTSSPQYIDTYSPIAIDISSVTGVKGICIRNRQLHATSYDQGFRLDLFKVTLNS